MSLSKVKEYLKVFNLENKILELQTSTATVKDAAKSLNCNEERIAKTLSLQLKDKVILIVTAGNVKIDNSKFKVEFKERAHMLQYDKVETIIGHPVGGVCPFGINNGIDIYLDISLKNYYSVFPACGSPNTAIELTIEELEKTTNYKKWIDVTK